MVPGRLHFCRSNPSPFRRVCLPPAPPLVWCCGFAAAGVLRQGRRHEKSPGWAGAWCLKQGRACGNGICGREAVASLPCPSGQAGHRLLEGLAAAEVDALRRQLAVEPELLEPPLRRAGGSHHKHLATLLDRLLDSVLDGQGRGDAKV